MSRDLPTECEHGVVVDWGHFGPCQDCAEHPGEDCPNFGTCEECAVFIAYDRAVLVDVLIYHQRTESSGCGCGWGELGHSHAEHIVDVYEASVAARAEDQQ